MKAKDLSKTIDKVLPPIMNIGGVLLVYAGLILLPAHWSIRLIVLGLFTLVLWHVYQRGTSGE